MKLLCQFQHRYPGGFQLDIDFETENRRTVLFGPSGSGKTTILSVIAGIVNPQQGRVSVDGKRYLDSASGLFEKPENRGVGYVFQQPNLFPHMTVRQNLEAGRRWRRTGREAIDLERVVEILEIERLLDRRPGNLSGGEKQRVALGRALASRPAWLLMDEPVAHLDLALRTRVLEYLHRTLDEWNVPLVYVTHSRQEAEFLGGQLLQVLDGKVIADKP